MTQKNLAILAFGAHPDDVELSAGGTLAKHIAQNHLCGIVDLTRGELGTRGNAENRHAEAAESARILGVSMRENLDLGDGFFDESRESLLAVIRVIRQHKPQVVLANAISDRHPDHARAASLVSRACFLSGLNKIEILHEGVLLPAHRPQSIYHYIQDYNTTAHLIVDISAHFDIKMKAVMAFNSQFYDPTSTEPETPISTPLFLEFLRGRAVEFGRIIGCQFGEGFTCERAPGTHSFIELL
ncbi:MAG: bacillithiol biosynthesis deacetylase BshB1 [Bacteroidetes bacterium]|nr:bacillithiol biosynthesis deacetylase BshB1 [Bacteroidota bacterium]